MPSFLSQKMLDLLRLTPLFYLNSKDCHEDSEFISSDHWTKKIASDLRIVKTFHIFIVSAALS
jgi:hypothetical protein